MKELTTGFIEDLRCLIVEHCTSWPDVSGAIVNIYIPARWSGKLERLFDMVTYCDNSDFVTVFINIRGSDQPLTLEYKVNPETELAVLDFLQLFQTVSPWASSVK